MRMGRKTSRVVGRYFPSFMSESIWNSGTLNETASVTFAWNFFQILARVVEVVAVGVRIVIHAVAFSPLRKVDRISVRYTASGSFIQSRAAFARSLSVL